MSTKCLLCQESQKDDLKYGEFMVKGNIAVHYYCLLLTSNLVQRGSDDEGFLGFLPQDIRNESRRVRKMVCCYCRKPSANIACCKSKCQHMFHLSCGIREGCVNQFINTFRSFCNRHSTYEKRLRPPPDEICSICYDNLGSFKRHLVFRAPCCKAGWFHRWCLAKMALNAGYFFKCPLCNNKDQFRDYFLRRSIFVPDQDAAWEFEPNAFADLLERPNTCTAEKCKCPQGRQYDNETFELLICNICGSNAQHKACITGKKNLTTFTCKDCEQFVAKNDDIEDNTEVYVDKTEEETDVDVEIVNIEENMKREGHVHDESDNHSEQSQSDNKCTEDLEMPVLSPYKVPPMEDFSSCFPRNKRKRTNDSDLVLAYSEENIACKSFKIDNPCDESDDSCASCSGVSRCSGKSMPETPLKTSTDKKDRGLNILKMEKSLSVEFLAQNDYFTKKEKSTHNSLQLQRRHSEICLSPECTQVQQRTTRSLSTGSEYVRTARSLVRRSARIRRASQERLNSYSDSGVFSTSSSDGESSFARRRPFFAVIERFGSSPSLQTNLLKYNFKDRHSVKLSC